MTLQVHPLTPDRWPDYVRLMGPKGGAAGCWCALWRVSAGDFRSRQGEGNRRFMQERVRQGPCPPGLIAYRDSAPVGWISVAPRAEFPRMAASRITAPVDDSPVWSVTCFFIRRGNRGEGVATALLEAACRFAAAHGARVVEGYPIDPLGERYAAAFAWTGLMRVFERAGFAEVARRSEKRPVMRREVTTMTEFRTGRCLCGAVRFTVAGPVEPPMACHCRQCQRQTGSFWIAITAPRASVQITGEVAWFSASPRARRGFCPRCGGFLFWEPAAGNRLEDGTIDIAFGCLDDTEGLTFAGHIWCESARLPIPEDGTSHYPRGRPGIDG